MTAPWPVRDGPVDKEAIEQFEALQAVTRAIRNARAEYGVELGRKIPATVCASDEALRCGALWAVHGVATHKSCCFCTGGPGFRVPVQGQQPVLEPVSLRTRVPCELRLAPHIHKPWLAYVFLWLLFSLLS